MKNIKYISGILLLSSACLSSCVDDSKLLFNVEKPETLASMEYLDDYDFLKTYVDRSANPNFKLGAAVNAEEYANKGMLYRLVNANFDEITAGNAMKFASCVADDGTMDFSKVQNFVSAAADAGLSVYGHTLAWHSQQNNKYLNKLIADKEIEFDPNAKVEKFDVDLDYSTFSSYSYWHGGSGYTIGIKDNMLEIDNPTAQDPNYSVQYFGADNISLDGGEYEVRLMIKGSGAGSIAIGLGTWSSTIYDNAKFDEEWKEVKVSLNGVPAGGGIHVMLQSGNFAGTIQMKSLKVLHYEAPSVKIYTNLAKNGDCEGDDLSCLRATGNKDPKFGAAGTGADGKGRSIVITSLATPTNSWDTQFFVTVPDYEFQEGDKFRCSFNVKASKEAKISFQSHSTPGNYIGNLSELTAKTGWNNFSYEGTVSADMATKKFQTIAFNLNEVAEAIDYYFDDVTFDLVTLGNTMPQTPEEKKDTLTKAMSKWINGMMLATEGKVKAWDVVNEAISETDADGDGYYDLQSANFVTKEEAKNNFYWQDYLGSVDYVRTAVKAARDGFAAAKGAPADLKLFINDYNLETDYNQNKKLTSLIHWIGEWEKDGKTKIDGIGTQMHVSFYANAGTQKNKEDAIVNMFKLLADTKKLVKISELDMGYIDASNNKLKTSELTEAQHKQMADFYKFIISKYFELIPAAQRYGITQWCLTDSKDDSSWRGGEPTGLWDSNYRRKHTYGSFADGLKNSNK